MQQLADARAQTTWIHCDIFSAIESLGDVVLGGHEPNGMQQYVGQKAYDGATLPCKVHRIIISIQQPILSSFVIGVICRFFLQRT